MVPQASGESAKVKVKVRVNIHGLFSVSGASLVEVVKTAEGEEPMETDQAVKEEEVCIVHSIIVSANTLCCIHTTLYLAKMISPKEDFFLMNKWN